VIGEAPRRELGRLERARADLDQGIQAGHAPFQAQPVAPVLGSPTRRAAAAELATAPADTAATAASSGADAAASLG
jgi:hypothetical protein